MQESKQKKRKEMFTLREDTTIKNNHYGYVTTNTLLHLNVLNQSWVRIALKDEGETNKDGVIVAKHFDAFEKSKDDYVLQLTVANNDFEDVELFEIFDEKEEHCDGETILNGDEKCCDGLFSEFSRYKDDVIYVSSLALFNIANQDVSVFEKCRSENCSATIFRLQDFEVTKKVHFASNVEISAVSCLFGTVSDDVISKILKQNFEETKVLRTGEIFSITCEKTRGRKSRLPAKICFKVKSMEQNDERHAHAQTNFRFVNSYYSNLYLCNPVKSYVPGCPCTYQNNTSLITLFLNLSFTEAYEAVVTQISDLVKIVCSHKVRTKDAMLLLEGRRGVGKGLLTRNVCFKHSIHYHEENCFDLIGESLSATERRIENAFQFVKKTSPCVLYLKNVHVLCKDKEGVHEERRVLQFFVSQVNHVAQNEPIMVIGSTYCSNAMSSRFYSEFVYHIEVDPPNETERECIIKVLTDNIKNRNVCHADVAKKTAGFILSDFIGLFTRTISKNLSLENASSTSRQFFVSNDNIDASIEELRTLKAGSSDSVKIPKVTWDDVGGLQSVKADILDTLELPLKFPNLFSNGLQRSGLLFYGPPGCGKTLLAKAIATEFTLNFYSVKGPELINMYVGQSEENVREVFKKARSMAPCIIFFDELDSLAPNRGRSGDSGGVMDRIVSQLLSELDGMHDNTHVFVVGATNRPDLLDNALLRPGRFDKLVYVGVPERSEERIKILKAVTRKITLAEDVKVEEVEKLCPVNLTGADFYALASDATMNCFRRLIKQHEEERKPLNCDRAIVTMSDFEAALYHITPSVSINELKRYKAIKQEILHKQ